MAPGHVVTRLEEFPPRNGMPGTTWHPVRSQLGIEAFGVNAWTAREAGAEVIEEHDESGMGHEELYVVLSGHARFRLDGEEVDAPAGTFVAVAPRVTRVAHALEAGTTVLAIGAKPGAAFTPSDWEARALA